MKKILTIVFLHAGLIVFGQKDSVVISPQDVCPDLFRKQPTDSTYLSFYVTESCDTVYFDNERCVILPQISDPYGVILWVTKNGMAEGNFLWVIISDSSRSEWQGEFHKGRFVSGTYTEYYLTGNIKRTTDYQNGVPTGTSVFYFMDGTIEFKCEWLDCFVCADVNEPVDIEKKKRRAKKLRPQNGIK